MGVVALCLEGLVVEVLHGFVIDQAIDGLGIGGGVRLIELPTQAYSLVDHSYGEYHIRRQREQDDYDEAPVVSRHQNP